MGQRLSRGGAKDAGRAGALTGWLKEHSLSLSLIALYLVWQGLAAAVARDPMSADYWQSMFQGHADDTLGAIPDRALYEMVPRARLQRKQVS